MHEQRKVINFLDTLYTPGWPTKDANAFMNKHLTLVPKQRRELESDLVQENFLKDFEKNPRYKASFDFKTKMFALMMSQRTSLVPLFKLTDFLARVKQRVDETLEISGAVVVPDDNPEAGFIGWGEEDVPSVFKPLLVPPQVSIRQEHDELDLSDVEGLDPEMARVIQEKARAKAAKNRKHANRALTTYEGLF